MYEPIIDALRRGAAAEAVAAARQAVQDHPQDHQAHRLLAAALRLDGDRAGAVAALDHAIGLAPEEADLHLERAGLLLAERKIDEAQASLARSLGLDPNQFAAYIVQGQLALARGDLDEAERLVRTAARIAAEHPHVSALEGSLALRRGDADRALAILNQASTRWPEDQQLVHALAFAYLAKGHLAFAEQAFRRMLDRTPDSAPLRALVADVLRRQGRPAEAADVMAPLLERTDAGIGLKLLVGQIELQAGRHERARPLLREAFAARPEHAATLVAMVEAWRRGGAQDEARETLEQALAEHPGADALWRARLLFEPFAGPGARAVVDRWTDSCPDSLLALEALSRVQLLTGDDAGAEATLRRMVELQPGHAQAEIRLVDTLVRRGAGDDAIARVEQLMAAATTDEARANIRHLLAMTSDALGRYDTAASVWTDLQAEAVPRRLPLPPVAAQPAAWPPRSDRSDAAQPVLLLWGAPGSRVEQVAQTLLLARAPLRNDRFGSTPPKDFLQRYDTAPGLADGSVDPAQAIAQWRGQLAARGSGPGPVMDWLLWWDNTLLLALRPHLPEAELMFVVRDPRDMLLDWLAWGAPAPLAMESPAAAAQWLAQVLEQICQLHEQDLFPHHLVRADDLADRPEALAQALGAILGGPVAAAPAESLGPPRFPAGHWRHYSSALGDAFARLAPVAARLGYPEA